MRLITVNSGTVELNYMWLPTFIGQNATFKKKLEEDLRDKIEGREVTPANLDDINSLVLSYICETFKFTGLNDYLDGLKFVLEGTNG